MSLASIDRSRVWTAGATSVVGGDAAARRYVTRLLREAGVDVGDEPAPDVVAIALSRARDSQRVNEIRELAASHPQACLLAVMPAEAANATLRKAMLAGARGIVLEPDLERALVPTVLAMLAGQLTVPQTLARQIAPRPLSHREKEILSLVVTGLTNREIATRLYLAESTVKTHLSSAFRKIDARSRAEAVARLQDPETGYGMELLATADAVPTRVA